MSLESHFERSEKMPDHGMMSAAGGHYPNISTISREMAVRSASIRLMYGHYHISAQHLLENPIVLVVLREPVAQLISHMRHFIAAGQFTSEHCLKSLDEGKCPVQHNILTRYLGGSLQQTDGVSLDAKHQFLMNGPVEESRVGLAIDNLQRTDVVGFTDEMPKFIKSVEQKTNIPIVEQRVNEAKVKKLDLTPSQLATLMELNKYDLDLYSKAQKFRIHNVI